MADTFSIPPQEIADQSSKSKRDGSIPECAQIPRSKSILLTKVNRHAHEGEHEPESWLKHKSHVIVLTFSGKPVYTRYGSEDMIAGFTGTLQALVSKFAVLGLSPSRVIEQLKSISFGNLRIVFLDRSPLLFVSISKHANVTISSIERMLKSVHSQLIFVLTNGVNHTLEQRPNFDVRSLLGGTRPLIGNLISWMHNQMFLCTQGVAVETLPLPFATRSSLSRIVQTDIPACCLYSVLLCGHRVVCTGSNHWESGASNIVSASDLVLLINVVCSSSNSLLKSGQGECWTPVCLPSVSGDAFVYAYIQYMAADVSLVSICVDPDNENFYCLSDHGRQTKETLEYSAEIATIFEWSNKCPLSLSRITTEGGEQQIDQLLLNVKHCAIVLNQSRQIFSSACEYSLEEKKIFQTYTQCMSLLESDDPTISEDSQQVSMTTNEDFVFIWITSEFQLFLTAPRGIDISVITRVYQWLRDNEQTLFISNLSSTNEPGTRLSANPSSLW